MKTAFKATSLPVLFLSGLLIDGCTGRALDPTASEKTVQQQDQAGSSHVAVLSSSRFEDYRDALQPTFKMSSEDALAQAIPSTLLVEERILDAFKAALRVALPSTSVTQTETTTKQSGADTQQKLERVEKTEPGDISKATFGDSPAKDQDLSKLAPKDSVVTGTPSLDPMLRHVVATALYQEVQMLNRYVRDAARGNPDKYDAHVVRLQVTVLPSMRTLPYDVYTTISFFNGDFECESSPVIPPNLTASDVQAVTSKVYKGLVPTTQPAPTLDAAMLKDISNPAEASVRAESITTKFVQSNSLNRDKQRLFQAALSDELACRLHDGKESAPQVVPLLVTDSIEAAMHSRSVDELRQLGLALSAMLQGVGVGGDLQKVDQTIRNVLGRDFNSTFTVGRVSDNTIRVRFGAIQNPDMAYSMVPQTHNVTLLILIPKMSYTGDVVRFVARTEFLHARTGAPPQLRTTPVIRNLTISMLCDYGVDTAQWDNQKLDNLIDRVLSHVDRNDYTGFKRLVVEEAPTIKSIESLWLDVVNLKTGGRYAAGRILLQPPKKPKIYRGQTPVVIDDGEKTSVVTLLGLQEVVSTTALVPVIKIEDKEIPAAAMTLTENGSRLLMSFPSLKALGFKIDPTKLESPKIAFRVGSEGGDLFASIASYQLTKIEQPKSLVAISASTKTIRSLPDGTQQLIISFSTAEGAKEPAIVFKVEGADVRSATVLPIPVKTNEKAPEIVPGVGKWLLSSSANVEVKLANLDPASPVTISATGAKETEGTPPAKLSFTVSPLPVIEKK